MSLLGAIMSQRRRSGGGGSYDADAAAYIAAVEAADGAALETGTKDAMNAFFVALKSASLLAEMKAGHMTGARTVAGFLVPLMPSWPVATNNGFVLGDLNRKTGFKGDGSSKSLLANYDNLASAQDDRHLYIRLTEADTLGGSSTYIGTNFVNGGSYARRNSGTAHGFRSASGANTITISPATGGWGAARNNGTTMDRLAAGSLSTVSQASLTPVPRNNAILAAGGSGVVTEWSDARFAIYSLGDYLDMSVLDGIVTTYLAAIAASIP